ncbi:MAG: sugar phosphate nucleotidyltransferase [Thermodesulfobacteriota bacterium]
MKALILSAGFGTRLMPYTKHLPKPLFPVGGKPMLGILIDQLIAAGAGTIAVNTHYAGQSIADYLAGRNDAVPVIVRHEPQILGTGGAIKNFSDVLDDAAFVVINSDILTDIDIGAVYQYHLAHSHPATLVVHDRSEFNTVSVSAENRVTGFSGRQADTARLLAFTGLQVLDPQIHARIPADCNVNSIDVYREMIESGQTVVAYTASGHYWNDLGTPARYRAAVADCLAPAAFQAAFEKRPASKPKQQLLAGDGSERKWFRLTSGDLSLVLADHGITIDERTSEVDAFVAIGRHLHQKGIPVPEIFAHDRFSGLVFLQDLGDCPLQQQMAAVSKPRQILDLYRPVIDALCSFAVEGAVEFDPRWTHQGERYDRTLIVEKEGRYFTEALVKGYLDYHDFSENQLMPVFQYLADQILTHSVQGLIHRDMQSRNIMVHRGRHYFIDFQGARFGPVQYDLASLLADPYVALTEEVREQLLGDAMAMLQNHLAFDTERFATGFQYCIIARLMQALGAYGHLTKIKEKPQFERYIPAALHRLDHQLHHIADFRLSPLTSLVCRAKDRMDAAGVNGKWQNSAL